MTSPSTPRQPAPDQQSANPPARRMALRTRSVFADMLDLDLPADQRAVAETIYACNSYDQPKNSDGTRVTVAGPASTIFDQSPRHRTDAEAIRNFARSIDERYRLRTELGRGGMATVYDAIDTDLRRHVAMKILQEPKRKSSSPASSDDRSPLQRFIEEAQITGQLEHPNIVPVHEIGVDAEGRVYFTMKRVEGRSLREVMDDMRKGDLLTLERFDIFKFCDILRKICDAIGFAHSRGVIHRDLKPDNVMVGRFGEVQVMDWGLAKVRTRQEKDSRSTETFTDYISTDNNAAINTLDGTISGTPAYMPPEQARGLVSQIDERSDVFALGALLYEMITLVPPYHARSSRDALKRAQKYELRSPAESIAMLAERRRLPDDSRVHVDAISRARKMPKELAAIAMKALAERPSDRYESVQELDDDLEHFLKNEPVTAYRDPPVKALTKWAGRNRVLATSAAAVFVMAMISVLVVLALLKTNADARLDDERALLASAQKAKEEAEKRAALELAQADRAQIRARAIVPFSAATDLVNRASASVDPDVAYRLGLRAKDDLSTAIAIDPTFEGAFIWRGHVNEMLGLINQAMDDLLHANELRKQNGDPEDPASLVNAAMLAATRSLLLQRNSTLGAEFFLILKRAHAAADEESAYFELADIMLDWDSSQEAARARSGSRGDAAYAEELLALSARMDRLRERASELWEVHLFSGVFTLVKSWQSGNLFGLKEANEIAQEHFKRAQRIRPQIPLVTMALAEFTRRSDESRRNSRAPYKLWSDYVERFPYDPLGYLGRAGSVMNAEPDPTLGADPLADLRKALELYDGLQEARNLMPRALQWTGDLPGAIQAYADLMPSYDPKTDVFAQRIQRQFVLEGYLSNTLVGHYLQLIAHVQADRMEQVEFALTSLQEQCAASSHVYRVYFHHLLRSLLSENAKSEVQRCVDEFMPADATVADALDAASALAAIGAFDQANKLADKAAELMAQGDPNRDDAYALGENNKQLLDDARARIQLLSQADALSLDAFSGHLRVLAGRLKLEGKGLSNEEEREYIAAILSYQSYASVAELIMAVRALARRDDLSGMEHLVARTQAARALIEISSRSPHDADKLYEDPRVQAFLPRAAESDDAGERSREDRDSSSSDDGASESRDGADGRRRPEAGNRPRNRRSNNED